MIDAVQGIDSSANLASLVFVYPHSLVYYSGFANLSFHFMG